LVLFAEHFNALTYAGMALVLVGVIGQVLWKPAQHRGPLAVGEA
jgi:drug/metabolite transporter (DMT)-like permease